MERRKIRGEAERRPIRRSGKEDRQGLKDRNTGWASRQERESGGKVHYNTVVVGQGPKVVVDIPIVVVTVPHEEDEELGVRGEGWQKGYNHFKFRWGGTAWVTLSWDLTVRPINKTFKKL